MLAASFRVPFACVLEQEALQIDMEKPLRRIPWAAVERIELFSLPWLLRLYAKAISSHPQEESIGGIKLVFKTRLGKRKAIFLHCNMLKSLEVEENGKATTFDAGYDAFTTLAKEMLAHCPTKPVRMRSAFMMGFQQSSAPYF